MKPNVDSNNIESTKTNLDEPDLNSESTRCDCQLPHLKITVNSESEKTSEFNKSSSWNKTDSSSEKCESKLVRKNHKLSSDSKINNRHTTETIPKNNTNEDTQNNNANTVTLCNNKSKKLHSNIICNKYNSHPKKPKCNSGNENCYYNKKYKKSYRCPNIINDNPM